MSVATFGKEYRAISWAYIKFMSSNQRKKFSQTITKELSGAQIKKSYVGACFGKYNQVIDFWNQSGKVASHHLSRIQDNLEKEGIICSLSSLLCKPLDEGYKKIDSKVINSYTFFKPTDNSKSITEIIQKSKEIVNELGNSTEAYWNNSMYPILIITHSNNYDEVAKHTQTLRTKADWAMDSSSYITIKVKPNSDEPEQDESCSDFPAIVFMKLSSMAHTPAIHKYVQTTRKGFPKIKYSSDPRLMSPLFRFGWYDVCDIVFTKSLTQLYNYVKFLKDRSKGMITYTSTLLLTEEQNYCLL